MEQQPTPRFAPKDPGFAARVQASFTRQGAMGTSGAVLTIEYKVNQLAAARGQVFRMVDGRAYAVDDGRDTLIATMTATVTSICDRPGVQD